MPGRHVSRVWTYDPTIDAPAKYRRACNYDAFIPVKLTELSLQMEGTVAGIASEADAAIRDLNESARPALTPLARLLLRTESMASSMIEGVRAGVRELARAEAKVEAGRKASATALEVLANIDAMQLAMDEASAVDRFGVREIVAIHRRLMERDINVKRIAGQIRTSQNWIGGNDYNPCSADFVPPPSEEVQGLLDDLCDAINDHRLPPIVQAAIVHAQFETIHPFADGNGRTGRALIHVVLKRRRVAPAYVPPISVVLAANRDRYIEGLTRFRGERVSDWIEQFAAAAHNAARLAGAYLREVLQLSAAWRAKLSARPGPPRSDAAAWAVIDALPGYPVISAPVAAAVTGRSKPQIYEALDDLEAAGVLTRLSASRRNRGWEAVGLLDLLERLEAGQLPH
ncbi:MAG TPA: Fic family protein [Gemmatimonadales bacterium]|nr:Fic family protein [Gemmatimonadales bacterium]